MEKSPPIECFGFIQMAVIPRQARNDDNNVKHLKNKYYE